jgi:aryl-alcohol dehydrogenase-like predicted oxidoreductase
MVSVSVAWVLRQPGVTSAIIGASRPEQLDANLNALNIEFNDELLEACDAAWWQLPRRPIAEGYR